MRGEMSGLMGVGYGREREVGGVEGSRMDVCWTRKGGRDSGVTEQERDTEISQGGEWVVGDGGSSSSTRSG